MVVHFSSKVPLGTAGDQAVPSGTQFYFYSQTATNVVTPLTELNSECEQSVYLIE
ncbi:hypothetical protein BH18ACI3_BH18ACI3_19270 [soil metagenome]